MVSSNKKVEVLQNLEYSDISIVGQSISTLARFANEKLPVANGFVVTTLGFHYFVDFSDIKKYYENSKKTESKDFNDLSKSIENATTPEILKEEILKSYSKISGFTDAYVNLRALILDKDGKEIKHRAFVKLDVRGGENILTAIKHIYRAIILDNHEIVDKFFSGALQIVILIQKAQQSEASGVMFTTDVITNDKDKLVIEAVYGLESIAEIESIIPDQYIYDKKSQQILEKHITTQEYMAVRQPSKDSDNIQKVKISLAWQKRQKLDDKHILTLARTGQIVEEGLEESQQVLWAFESGKIWINFIESSQKISFDVQDEPTLQNLVDEQFIDLLENTSEISVQKDGLDLNVHIPESISENKDILMDLVLSENEDSHAQIKNENALESEVSNNQDITETQTQAEELIHLSEDKEIKDLHQHSDTHKDTKEEPLLEGKYFSGNLSQGEVCFSAENCKKNSILVLKGDENLPSQIKVAGFIIEEESELLAQRLSEYFDVPTITGVPLARKILKQGELIKIDGGNGFIYETIPFSEQVGEIEMNFVATSSSNHKETHLSIPVTDDENISVHTEIHHDHNPLINQDSSVEDKSYLKNADSDSVIDYSISNNSTHIDINANDSSDSNDIKVEQTKTTISTSVPADATIEEHLDKVKDISKLLDLVEEDSEIVDVKEDDNIPDLEPAVEGLDEKDQFNIWGKSLERIISESKEIPATVAVEALESVIDDAMELAEESKEIAFDQDEEQIAEKIHHDEEHKKFNVPYIPTATKVYVNLIDEKLPAEFKNFDGIIFSSSFDQEFYLELLEDVLETTGGKEVFAVCPPYETAALERFLAQIYELRNNGHRHLSLILPDYRNKKEITETKKLLSINGLKRSSTFGAFANVSRTINVFRIAELSKTLVDGVYIDLFRLKMNMLGIEKHSASTKYVEGMKNLVSYINENLIDNEKSIINITGFENPSMVLEHVLGFKFWAVACSLPQANKVKEEISSLEKRHISLGTNKSHTGRLKRRK